MPDFQKSSAFRHESLSVGLNPGSARGEFGMAFQRKNPAAIGVKAPFPGFVDPELATSIGKVPSGKRWVHDIKFDGYRVQVHLIGMPRSKSLGGCRAKAGHRDYMGAWAFSRTGYPAIGNDQRWRTLPMNTEAAHATSPRYRPRAQ